MNPPGPPGGQNKPSSSSRSKAAPQKPLTEAEKRQMRKAYLNKVAGPMPYTFPPLSSHEITQMPLYSYVESEFESSNTRQAFKDALNEMLKKTDWKKTVSAKSAEYMEQHPEWTIEEIIGASVEDSRRAVPKEVAIELYRMCAEFCRKTLQERYLGREEPCIATYCMKFTDLLDRFPQFYVKYMTSSESKTLVSPQRTRIERVDRICAESGGGCYVVSDFVDSKTNEAWRAIHSEKATNSSQMESHFSRAALIVQNDTTSSKDWSVDHTTILAQYIAVMAALPFATGSLLKAKPTILSIGLGGGVLDMFLHTARPKFEVTVVESDPTIIDIAHKWFGVEETTNRKTVNDSGIDFLSNTVKNDRTPIRRGLRGRV